MAASMVMPRKSPSPQRVGGGSDAALRIGEAGLTAGEEVDTGGMMEENNRRKRMGLCPPGFYPIN